MFAFQEVTWDNSSKQDAPQLKDKSMISGKEENGVGKPSLDNISCVIWLCPFNRFIAP